MAVCAGQLKRTMIILLCVTTSAWAAPGDDSLPPPPDAQTMNNDAIFQLSVVINHYDTGLVVPVTQRRKAGRGRLAGKDLARVRLEGQQGGGKLAKLGVLAKLRQHGLMPKVDTVKIADG